MAIKKIKKETQDLISAIPGVKKSESLSFSRLIFSSSVAQSQTYAFSKVLNPGYYYAYYNNNNSRNSFSVAIKNSTGQSIGSFNFSSNTDQKFTYLNTTAASIEASQTIAFSTIGTAFTTNIIDIVYGAGLYVAASSGVQIQTSTDLITWTQRTANVSGDLVYGSLGFVKVPASGTGQFIARSTDGITWISSAGPAASSRQVFFENNFYIIFATNVGTTIFYSTNITNWASQPTTRTANRLNAAAYGNGLYVVGDILGFIVTSTDLITWTSRPRATTAPINEIIYANNQFFIFSTTINAHRRTTDFVTYTTLPITFSTASGVSSAAYRDERFLAVSGIASGPTVASTDGITWEQIDDIGGNKTKAIIQDNVGIVVGNSGQMSRIELRNSAELQIYKI